MADGAVDQTRTQMEIDQQESQGFEHDDHENVHYYCPPLIEPLLLSTTYWNSEPIPSQKVVSNPGVYHKDPTSPRPYTMDRRKYNKLICENLLMNEDLITSPDDEKYHNVIRTATQDLSSVNDNHKVRDWDSFVSPTKYKGFKNCKPGKHGAPYDYRKYLPEEE